MRRSSRLAGWTIGVAAAAALVGAGGAAWAGDGVCKSVQRGARGEHLRVALHVEHGQVTGADVVFSPPVVPAPTPIAPGATPVGTIDDLRLQLDLHYPAPAGEADLGRLGEVALDAYGAHGQPIAALAKAHATLAADDGTRWEGAASLVSVMLRATFATDLKGARPLHPELLARLATLDAAQAELHGPDGALIGQARYDLSDHAARDALLHQAWTRAKALADAPEPCS